MEPSYHRVAEEAMNELSDQERAVLSGSERVGTASMSHHARVLDIGYGNGWAVVDSLVARGLLVITDLHHRHVRTTGRTSERRPR